MFAKKCKCFSKSRGYRTLTNSVTEHVCVNRNIVWQIKTIRKGKRKVWKREKIKDKNGKTRK